jgi:tRNA(adenine34) deaminase
VNHHLYMQEALQLAQAAAQAGEVPVGAVVVLEGEVIGRGANAPIGLCDPSAHAEILALRDAAARTGNYRLPGSCLYVTIEPCAMCFGAMVHARVAQVVFGAPEPKAGVVSAQGQWINGSWFNHRVVVEGGVCEAEASALMQAFFAQRRAHKKALRRLAQGYSRSDSDSC